MCLSLTTALRQVVELPRTATGYGAQITLPLTAYPNPTGVALDSDGNVFVAQGSGALELPGVRVSGYGTQIAFDLGLVYRQLWRWTVWAI